MWHGDLETFNHAYVIADDLALVVVQKETNGRPNTMHYLHVVQEIGDNAVE